MQSLSAGVAAALGAGRCLDRRPTRTSRVVALAAPEEVPKSSPAPEVDLLQEVLRDCKEVVVLQKADKETILELVQSMEEVSASAGEVIVRQGDQIGSMYIVVQGDLVVEKTPAGSAIPLTKPAARGDYFGAVTLLGNTPQKTTIVAQSDCRLWRLDRHVFDAVILAHGGRVDALQDESWLDEDEEDDDGEDEDGDLICSADALREIFIVSDSTGESASASVRAALRQFDYCFGSTCGTARSTVYRFVRSAKEAREIVDIAGDRNALLVHTVMEPKVHEAVVTACQEKGVESCDLWGALLESLEKKFGAKRSGVSGRRQPVSDEYMTIVKAIEYTRKVDDGVLPHLWGEADIMLVGPSRAGKTPLAFYLAQRGFKVANYPIVPEEEVPPELFEITQSKVIGLLIQPERLQAIRIERMAQFGRTSTQYASLERIRKEVRWIKNFYLRHGSQWPIIDTTNAGVVETAARITEIFDRRKGDSLAAAYESPLTD